MKFSSILAIFGLSISMLQSSESALEYLNTLRGQSGLAPLAIDPALQRSAQAHSHYLALQGITGHAEEAGREGFTGETPSARAFAAGYDSVAVSENVSSGQKDIYSSIDKLFSGIYHRFAFLDMKKDLVGIGVESKNYTYDLGNSLLNRLCREHTYTGGSYYRNACRESEKKIEVSVYDRAVDHYKLLAEAPEAVVWPPKNGQGILPGFYAENPDPLPDYAVSGYPVSVEFNDALSPEAPEEVEITLQDSEGNELEGIFMDRSNDPMGRFTDHQFAFFPREHLEWGARYQVKLEYDGTSREWCFATRSLASFGADKVYRIDQSDDASLEIVSGTTYALYLVPQGPDDQFDRYRYRYNTEKPSVAFVDRNTLLVTVTGEAGQRVELSLNNPGGQKITLYIAEEDRARTPRAEVCPTAPSAAVTASYTYPSDTSVDTEISSDEAQEEKRISQEQDTEEEEVAGKGGGSLFILALLWFASLLSLVSLRGKRLFND